MDGVKSGHAWSSLLYGYFMGMDAREFKALLISLPSLSSTQRDDILQRLRYLGSSGVEENTSGADWLLKAIFDQLKRHGLLGKRDKPSLSNAQRLSKHFIKNANRSWEILLAGVGRDLSGTEQARLAQLAAQVMIGRQKEGTVTLKSLLRVIHLLPQRFDRAFPGYLAAGLVGVVLKTDLRDGVKDG